MLMSAWPSRGNDDTDQRWQIGSTLFVFNGGRVRSVQRVVSMVSVSYSPLSGWSFVTGLSSLCPPHSFWIMALQVDLHMRPAFDNSCPEWIFSGGVNYKCGSKCEFSQRDSALRWVLPTASWKVLYDRLISFKSNELHTTAKPITSGNGRWCFAP